MKQVQHHTGAATRPVRPIAGRRRIGTPIACMVTVVLAVLAITGCGSSAPAVGVVGAGVTHLPGATPADTFDGVPVTTSRPGDPTATDAPAGPKSGMHHGTRAKVHALPANAEGKARIIHGDPVRRPAPGTGGDTFNDDHPKGSEADTGTGVNGPTNPCTLLTRAQVQSASGRPAARPALAPLGPTCVFPQMGTGAEVTIAVELAVFNKLKPHIHKLSELTIGGRTAYCGVYGTRIVYVPLPMDRLLTITAPCAVGAKLASDALPKLPY